MKDSFGSDRSKKRTIIWAVLFVFLAAGSIAAVTTASKSFSVRRLAGLLEGSAPQYIVLAFIAMLGFVLFEGLAIRTIVRSFGQRCTVRKSVVFSASDIYFSAITPSATGGQPACAYFMIKNGIPASCTTASLVFNLALYTVAGLLIALATVIFAPNVYLHFRPVARVLIIIGSLILIVIVAFFILALTKISWVSSVGEFLIKTGCRLRVIRNPERLRERLRSGLVNYGNYVSMIPGRWPAMAKALGFNLAQRLCQLSVTMFMYIAIRVNIPGAERAAVFINGLELLGAQCLISIGSNFIPIPGAMGVADLMMLDGFRPLMSEADAAALELMARSVSFYSCVLLCMVIVAAAVIIMRRKNNTL